MKTSTTVPSTRTTKTKTIEERVPELTKEKQYITKKVDTSIAILNSPENDIVLESLLFLSKYADIKLRNLTYLQQLGITSKLLRLLDRNICILRLVLRVLALILQNTSVLDLIDQDIYDDKILKISNLYTTHKDQNVREFSLDILSSLAKSVRITCVIFKPDLLKAILETIPHSSDTNLRLSALNFLNNLLESPLALGILQKTPGFDVKALVMSISDENTAIAHIAYVIINKILSKDVVVCQKAFRENNLVEKVMEVIMDSSQKDFHKQALEVIENCLKSDQTNTYYMQSIQFLELCNWVKTCGDIYLHTCVNIFNKLTGNSEMLQVLYDLSVEESVISLLRSNDIEVVRKTYKTICNFTNHKYCCEDMLKNNLIQTLVDILDRENGKLEDGNEIVFETIYYFFIRTSKVLPILYKNNIIPILLSYFAKPNNFSKANNEKIIHMLYKFSLISEYQSSVFGGIFLEQLFNLAVSGTDFALLSLEILIHFVEENILKNFFLREGRTKLLLQTLKMTSDTNLKKFILLFIRRLMLFAEFSKEFVKNDVLGVIKTLLPSFLSGAPIVETIKTLAYNCHLSLKFFETGKLDVTDKLQDRFYITKDLLVNPFPIIELIEAEKICPISVIYLVDYLDKSKEGSDTKILFSKGETELSKSLTPDPFLLSYIQHVQKYIRHESSVEEKVRFVAKYVHKILSEGNQNEEVLEKSHNLKLHLEFLKIKLQTSVIPVGYLRLGFHCEKSLVFKAIADRVNLPCTLEHQNHVYWNEVAMLQTSNEGSILKFYIVDLMNDVGAMLSTGSRNAQKYMRLGNFI